MIRCAITCKWWLMLCFLLSCNTTHCQRYINRSKLLATHFLALSRFSFKMPNWNECIQMKLIRLMRNSKWRSIALYVDVALSHPYFRSLFGFVLVWGMLNCLRLASSRSKMRKHFIKFLKSSTFASVYVHLHIKYGICAGHTVIWAFSQGDQFNAWHIVCMFPCDFAIFINFVFTRQST